MNLDLTGKRAIVCGSTQGIGKAAALQLARMGANVVLVARDIAKLEQCRAELDTQRNQQHDIISADYNFPEDLKVKVEQFIQTRGRADILVNNTGGPPGGPIASAKTEDFYKAFNNHLICNHIMVQAICESMKENKWGRIINVISTSVKQPLKGLGVSNTIRAAVANWSKTLSLELAPFGITVNNVLPGATSTQRLSSLLEAKAEKTGHSVKYLEEEMIAEIPAGRFAEPQEIANAIAFLASPAADYITGINLPVDGGRTGSL
jgi:3-oxoacyl-[acyl-carrier protein] reductase